MKIGLIVIGFICLFFILIGTVVMLSVPAQRETPEQTEQAQRDHERHQRARESLEDFKIYDKALGMLQDPRLTEEQKAKLETIIADMGNDIGRLYQEQENEDWSGKDTFKARN